MTDAQVIQHRKVVGRILFAAFFASLCYRFFLQVTPSQLLQPPLAAFNFDFTYWIIHLSGISQVVLHNKTGAIFFDLFLFGSCLLCFFFPLKQWIALMFGSLFFVYALCFNMAIVHHAHPLTIMTLITVPFFAKKPATWKLLWEAMRYYVCFVYFASFCWKVIGGSLFYSQMGVASLQSNLAEYLYHFPNTITGSVYQFFLQHAGLANLGLVLIFVLEGLMVIGFFTKKFDKYLLFIPVAVHLATYLFADVMFMEMLVGILPFISATALFKNPVHNNTAMKHEAMDTKAV